MHIFFQNNQYLGSYYFTRSADDPVVPSPMNIIELLLKCDPGWCCECSSAGLDLVTADCPPSPRQCARYSRAQYYSLPPAARFLPSVSISRYLHLVTETLWQSWHRTRGRSVMTHLPTCDCEWRHQAPETMYYVMLLFLLSNLKPCPCLLSRCRYYSTLR